MPSHAVGPIAHPAVAAGGADDEPVLDGQRRRGEAHLRLAIGQVGLPDHFAGILVGRDDAGRIIRRREDEVARQGSASILPAR